MILKRIPPLSLYSDLTCEASVLVDNGGGASWLVCAETVLIIAAVDIQLARTIPALMAGWTAAVFFKGVTYGRISLRVSNGEHDRDDGLTHIRSL